MTYNVVYLNLGGGSDSNDGSDATKAVKTWGKAYSLLPAYTGTTDADRDAAWDSNIIVMCDFSGIAAIKDGDTGNRPATITGMWPWTSDNITYAKVSTGGGVKFDAGNSNTARLGADTKFKYIRFGCSSTSTPVGYLCMFLHDALFDVGCIMQNFNDLVTNNGATAGRKAPDMEVFLYANTYNFSTSTTDGGWPQQTKPVTLTIKSGKFGRILSNRITGTSVDQVKQRYVIGNPSHPLMCRINVDIDPTTTTGSWNPVNYKDDIAFLCAGMTQGTEYADVEFNIKRGTIATLVGAMQGNSIVKTVDAGLSNSSFFGRTVTNIIPANDADVTIQRYYAACLGRYTSGDAATVGGISNAAFYGQSILNMHGGTIVSGAYVSAGGISGLQSPDGTYHTNDKFIPYLDNTVSANYPYMGIKYQEYKADGTMPTVSTILNGTSETIDLTKTVTQMNIYGGKISGGVFGGSYGYSSEMPAARAIAGAGSLWGETYVSIYGGTITGGIYGGGEGAPDYYNTAEAARKKDFLTVASVYGNTNVNIYGGNITGDIYGAGKGVTAVGAVGAETEFLNIAKVYGETNVLIDPTNPDWTFTGNVYGGGEKGAVEGNTNVIIKGGYINGNVFGAGQGEVGHPQKARVSGDTNVTIEE